jgi:hypothetical protein
LISALFGLVLAGSAVASTPECPTEHDNQRFERFAQRLADAPTPEAARSSALAKIGVAHRAIDRAEAILPGEARLDDARGRLDAFEARVADAPTQDAVANEVRGLIALGGGTGCSYDTTEVVVIVIGFVLGILPGILFLFLFC